MDCSPSNPPYPTSSQLLHPSKNNNNYNSANAANCFNDFTTSMMADYLNNDQAIAAMGAADQLNHPAPPVDPIWWDFGTTSTETTRAAAAAAASAQFNIMDNLPDVDSSIIMLSNNGNISSSDQISLFNHNIVNSPWPISTNTITSTSPLISLPLRVPDSDQNTRQSIHPNSISDGDHQMQQKCKADSIIHGSCNTDINGYPSSANYSTAKINGELNHERTHHHQAPNSNMNLRPIFHEYPLDHGPASNILISNSTCWPPDQYNNVNYYSDIINNTDHDLAAITQKSAADNHDNHNSRMSLINPAANFSSNPSSTCVFPLLMSGAKNAEALVTATISDHHHHLQAHQHQHYCRNHGAADYNSNGESLIISTATTDSSTRARNMTVHRPGQLQRASLQTNSNCSSTASNSTVISDTSSNSTALLQQSALKRPRTTIANDHTVMIKPVNSPSISSNPNISQPQLINNNAIVSSTVKPQVRKEKLGDRITILQQLVSPFGKTDTASVLLEAIGYIKFLQEQVQMLSAPYMASNTNTRTVPNQDCKAKLSDSTSTITGQQSRGDHIKAIKSSKADHELGGGDGGDDDKQQDNMQIIDLRSRGLCLVPVTWMLQVVNHDNGADYWTPNSLASSTITNISGF